MSLNTLPPPKLKEYLYSDCMHALDDVGWDFGFSFASYGVELGIRSTEKEVLQILRKRLPFKSAESKAQTVERMFSVFSIADRTTNQVLFNLYCDHALFDQKLSLDDLVERLQGLASVSIAELSTEKLFIHAGVVGWQGKGILVPGISYSGKSTLVAELVKLGASYYSDEFALLDDQGYVSPYAKPLSLRDPTSQRQHDVPIESIAGKPSFQRLRVGLVVISHFQKGADWTPNAISPGVGLLRLLENTHSAQRDPARAMRLIKKATNNARVIMGTRGEAEQTAHKILKEIPNSL